MMRLSLTRSMLGLMTLVAAILYLWPARQVYFHSDSLRRLSDGSVEDDQKWKIYLGRTDYSSRAWQSLDGANTLWKRKQYKTAIANWWQIAVDYRDTDAALAALDNVARAEVALGNRENAVHAWEILLMLPDVKHKDGGINLMNYRHSACVELSEYHESQGNYSMAERFVSQAIFQDPIRDRCGVYTSGVRMELESRLESLRRVQGK